MIRIAYSTLACPRWTVEQAADQAVHLGFEGIEWRLADSEVLGPRTPVEVWARIAKASQDRSLEAVCLDTSCSFVRTSDDERMAAVADTELMAQRAAIIGAKAIRVFGGRLPKGAGREDVVGSARDTIRAAAERAAEHGVALLVETHDAWARAADAVRLTDDTKAHVLWDVAHTCRADETPADSLRALGNRLGSVIHLKDATGPQLTLLGDGDVPLAEIVGLLSNQRFDGWLTFEWEKHWHPELAEPEEALPHAADALRRLVGRT